MVTENYSFLHNYTYSNKSCAMRLLDTLSGPVRNILGGRDIDMLSDTYSDKASICGRVTRVFFLVLVFPLGVISLTALAIKAASMPRLWQKPLVMKERDATWDVINRFKEQFNQNKIREAFQTYQTRPAIGNRSDVNKILFKISNGLINQGASWGEVAKALMALPVDDREKLITFALDQRIKKDSFSFTEKEFFDFVTASNMETPKLYEYLLKSTLLSLGTEESEELASRVSMWYAVKDRLRVLQLSLGRESYMVKMDMISLDIYGPFKKGVSLLLKPSEEEVKQLCKHARLLRSQKARSKVEMSAKDMLPHLRCGCLELMEGSEKIHNIEFLDIMGRLLEGRETAEDEAQLSTLAPLIQQEAQKLKMPSLSGKWESIIYLLKCNRRLCLNEATLVFVEHCKRLAAERENAA